MVEQISRPRTYRRERDSYLYVGSLFETFEQIILIQLSPVGDLARYMGGGEIDMESIQ